MGRPRDIGVYLLPAECLGLAIPHTTQHCLIRIQQ